MKVLHVISNFDRRGGGVVSAVAGLASAQAQAGMRVSIFTGFTRALADQSLAESLEARGVSVRAVGPCRTPLMLHPRMRRALAPMVADTDVVHIAALWEQAQHLAARLAARQGVPYVVSPHGMLDPWSLSQSHWRKRVYLALRLRRTLNGAAVLHFTSDLERDLAAPLGLRPRTVVVPNGLDLTEFQQLPPRGQFRRGYPQLGDRPIVLFLSRIHHKKGLDHLIPAFTAAQTGAAMLVIAGPDEGGYLATVRRLVAENGLQDRVIFTGMLYGRERIAAMVDAELYVLPSYQENFGIAVAEALAAGTPVIISDQVNIHPAVSAAGVGSVVPMDVAALSHAMSRWLGDPELRRAAASKARPFVFEHYDWRMIAQQWLAHYRSLVKPPAVAAAASP